MRAIKHAETKEKQYAEKWSSGSGNKQGQTGKFAGAQRNKRNAGNGETRLDAGWTARGSERARRTGRVVAYAESAHNEASAEAGAGWGEGDWHRAQGGRTKREGTGRAEGNAESEEGEGWEEESC